MSSSHEDDARSTGESSPKDRDLEQSGAPVPPGYQVPPESSAQPPTWNPVPSATGWRPGMSAAEQAPSQEHPQGRGQPGEQQWSLPPQQPYVQQSYTQQPYTQQPYPQPSSGYPPQPVWMPPVPVYPYTPWIRRVGAYLIDFAPALIAQIPFLIGYVMFYVRLLQLSSAPPTADPGDVLADLTGAPLVWMIIGVVLILAAIGWQWYNRWLIAGRTGQSMGKRMLKIRLVAEVNGQPIGPVNAFLRDLLHILDGAAYIGYLWPLWDAKRQTFSDMIMKTVVVDHPGQQTTQPSVAPGSQTTGTA